MEEEMKVDGKNLNQTADILGKAKNIKDKNSESATKILKEYQSPFKFHSQVDISDNARMANKIKDAAQAAPDVDQQKVAKFRELIDSGKYHVNAEAIADKMVDDELSFAAATKQ